MKATFFRGPRDRETHKIEIEWTLSPDGRFSMSAGVWDKTANGRWREDTFGQCLDTVLALLPDKPIIQRMHAVWKRWHLNDMRPACAHQVGPEWTAKDVTLYHFTTKSYVYQAVRDAEKRARTAIEKGEAFTPTAEETRLVNLASSISRVTPDLPEDLAKDYEPNGPKYKGDHWNRPSEVKSTSWLTEKEHPEGFLSKPCPTCGYKYGSAWLKEELPDDVRAEIESWSKELFK